MSDAPALSESSKDGEEAKNGLSPWPAWARQPFPRFSHLGGLMMGTASGLFGALAAILIPDLNILLVPVFALGLINPIMLSMLVIMPQAGRGMMLLGGLPIGGLAAAAAWFASTHPGMTPDVFAKMARPLSAASILVLLGAGPVAAV